MAGDSPRPRQATGEPWRAQREFDRLFSGATALAPVEDACARLASAADAREARDRAVEVFRTVIRVGACVALSLRARDATPLSGDDADALRQLLRRGLTDGQWVGLLRRLSTHPRVREALPSLAKAFSSRGFTQAVDGLLAMRTRETVAHGSGGTLEEVNDVLARRLPELSLVVDTLVAAMSGASPAPDDVAIRVDDGRWYLLDHGGKSGEAVLLALPDRDQHACVERGDALVAMLAEDDDEPCPYLGLRRFDQPHAAVFFGRTEEARRLAQRIEASPFVTITGPSGSGKSSLLAAGVAPALVGRELVSFRPGSAPIAALVAALADALSEPGALIALDELFRRSPTSASRAVEAHARARGKRFLVLVDQAEELVTLASLSERTAFAAALASLASTSTDALRVAMIVREDFFARVASLGALLDVATRAVEVVVDPSPSALVEMLTRPAALLGYAFSPPAFAARLADEIRVARAPLPLLSFVGERLFATRDKRRKLITEASFAARGGVAAALTDHAERALAELSPAERALARKMLVRLVTPEGTRAVVTAEELFAGVKGDPRAARVLSRLGEARLVVSSEGPRGDATYELVHEVLISEWPTLRDEIRREGTRLALRAELSRAAAAWEHSGRSPDLLLRGAVLARFVDLGDLHDSALALLAASTTAETRAVRFRRAAGIALTTALMATSLVLFAMYQRAEQASESARSAEQRAESALRKARRARYTDRAEARLAEGQPGEALAWLRAAHGQATRDHDEAARATISERLLRLTADGSAMHVITGLDGACCLSVRRGSALVAAGHRLISWDLRGGATSVSIAHDEVAQARIDADGRTEVLLASGRFSDETGVSLPASQPGRTWLGARDVLIAGRTGARLVSRASGRVVVDVPGKVGPRAGCVSASHAAIAMGNQAVRVDALTATTTTVAELELDVVDVACADDGTTAITGADRVVRLHDGSRVVATFTIDAPIARVSLDARRRLIATATTDGHIVVHRRGGAVVARLVGPRAPVALSFDDDKLVVIGSGEGRAFDIDARVGTTTAHRDTILGLSAGADGVVTTWSKDRTVLDVDAASDVSLVTAHPAALTTAAIGPTWVLSGGRDRETRLFDRRASVLLATVERPDGYVSATALSEAHGVFATGAVDRRIRVTRLSPRASWVSPPLGGAPFALLFSPDATTVGGLLDDGSFVFVGPTGALTKTLPAPVGMTEAYAVAASRGLLAFGGDDGALLVVDVASARALPCPPPLGTQVVATALSSDGKYFAAADGAGVVRVARVGDTAWSSTTAHGAPVTALALSSTGELVASAGDDGVLRVTATSSERLLGSWGRLPGRARAVAFSPDGASVHVAAGNALSSVKLDRDVDASTVFHRSGRATNYRLCEDDQRVVAVTPYPAADTDRVACPR